VTTAQSSAGAFVTARRGAVGVICFGGAGRRTQFVMSRGAIWSFGVRAVRLNSALFAVWSHSGSTGALITQIAVWLASLAV